MAFYSRQGVPHALVFAFYRFFFAPVTNLLEEIENEKQGLLYFCPSSSDHYIKRILPNKNITVESENVTFYLKSGDVLHIITRGRLLAWHGGHTFQVSKKNFILFPSVFFIYLYWSNESVRATDFSELNSIVDYSIIICISGWLNYRFGLYCDPSMIIVSSIYIIITIEGVAYWLTNESLVHQLNIITT